MKKPCKIFLFIQFTIYAANTIAQTKVIVNEKDTLKYTLNNPLLALAINPKAFKDGAYLFYDSAKASVLFEGVINNGIENGYYYAYRWDEKSISIPETKRKMKLLNGNIDSLFKVPFIEPSDYRINYENTHSPIAGLTYNFYFKQGLLEKLVISDPYFRFNYASGIFHEDTMSFTFREGKLNSIHFSRDSLFKINPLLKIEMTPDTAGLLRIPKLQKLYFNARTRLSGDSIRIFFKSYKEYENNVMELDYDSLAKLIRIVMNSGHPSQEGDLSTSYLNIPLVEILFDQNRCIKYLSLIDAYDEIEERGADPFGNEVTNKLYKIDSMEAEFFSCGILKWSK